MRSSYPVVLVLGLSGVTAGCGGDGSGPSNTPPTAAFTPSCASLVCTFADGSSDADGQVTAYSWDFGDGGVSGKSKDAEHTYATADTYGVTLTVTDNEGAANRLTKTVRVSAPPNADFAGSCVATGRISRVLYFDCTFTDQSTAAAGATLTGWAWDFRDGTTSTEQGPVLHHYTYDSHEFRPGRPISITVSLTVTDNNGLTNKVSKAVPVTGPQTAAAPTIDIGVPYGLVRYGLCYPAVVGPGVRGCRSSVDLSISNTGGGTLNWTASKDAAWLRISPKSGTAPSTLAVWVNATGVPPGSYSGQIKVSAPGATNSPQTVTVHFTRY